MQARFGALCGLAVLADGRVLVADFTNRIRLLSADLEQVSTVAGNGAWGGRDGAAAQATVNSPRSLAVLPDGRVLVSTVGSGVRILSADLQQVHTVVRDEEFPDGPEHSVKEPNALVQLPDGRVLVVGDGDGECRILAIEGFPAGFPLPTPMGPKPAAKKRALLAGGASASASSSSSSSSSSSGPPIKRGRSDASGGGGGGDDGGASIDSDGITTTDLVATAAPEQAMAPLRSLFPPCGQSE